MAKLLPMEARTEADLPRGPGWQYEPKWDGFRCLAIRDGDKIGLLSRSGKTLARYFPDMVAALKALKPRRFILDGELAIPVGEILSFDALQLRLHPAASRVNKLAAETPSILIAFDLLQNARGLDLRDRPLNERRRQLEAFFDGLGETPALRLSPVSTSRAEAERWLKRAGGGALDGVVAKRADDPYRSGERAMVKVKSLRTADCVVGGFRYASNSRLVGSLLLGLFNDEGKLDHVGFTSGIPGDKREALTRKVEALKGGPGFTGDAPGGPSRWSTERSTQWEPLKLELVAEVQYDHASGERFRHGTRFLRWRPDKRPHDCTFEQLRQEVRPSRLFPTKKVRTRTRLPAL
ncbi:MAG: ATP-dependent DNA ligase [Proteobacteria bacterium]|nr:ATP-dependent DNA ligase [Pseudomonadota bacterium]